MSLLTATNPSGSSSQLFFFPELQPKWPQPFPDQVWPQHTLLLPPFCTSDLCGRQRLHKASREGPDLVTLDQILAHSRAQNLPLCCAPFNLHTKGLWVQSTRGMGHPSHLEHFPPVNLPHFLLHKPCPHPL